MFNLESMFDDKIDKIKAKFSEYEKTEGIKNLGFYADKYYSEEIPPMAKAFLSREKFVALAMKRMDEIMPQDTECVVVSLADRRKKRI